MAADVILALVVGIVKEARHHHARRDVPAPALVLAVIEHESRGLAHVCAEHGGGSSRGPMQIWRAESRCTPEDDLRFRADYEPATNIREGVGILIADARYERRHCRGAHDLLVHYAGKGPAARRAAREIRVLERKIRKKGLRAWRTVT